MNAALKASPRASTLGAVRAKVQELLAQTKALQQGGPALERKLAQRIETLAMRAADLIADEDMLSSQVRRRAPAVRALSASDQWNPTASREAARQVQALRQAIDFPEFVTSLISGVFQSITRSNVQQLESISDLLGTVQASTEDFTSQQIRPEQAMAWALARFPFLSMAEGGSLQMREDVDLMEQQSLLKQVLGATDDEVGTIEPGDLEGTLIPLVQRKMGRDRQGVLATLVMMGLQRVVVDDGRLHASMDMRVDARSVSEQNLQDRSDFRISAGASGSFGAGAWGASASVSTSYGKVHSDQQVTREELASHAGLRSSVDLTFRTEQVPLDRMADQQARQRIAQRTPQPTAWPEQSGLSNERYTKDANLGEIPPLPAAPAARPTPPTPPTPAAPGKPGGEPKPSAQSPPVPAKKPPDAAGSKNGKQPSTGGAGRDASTSAKSGVPAGTKPAPSPGGNSPAPTSSSSKSPVQEQSNA